MDMTNNLLQLVDLDISYIRTEAVLHLADIIRVSPHTKQLILPSLSRCLKRVDDAIARASLVWIIGEYGNEIVESPYMIENIIENYNEENSIELKLQLLTTTCKLFFKRPPEVQLMLGNYFQKESCEFVNWLLLGKLLNYGINDNSCQDIHDRALFYYRLLNQNVENSKDLFFGQSYPISNYTEFRDTEKLNAIFSEFNSLSVIYDSPSKKFIQDVYQFVS